MKIEDKMREIILKINGGAGVPVPKILAILAEGATELSNLRNQLESLCQKNTKDI